MAEICKDCLECDINEIYGCKVHCDYLGIYVNPNEDACSHFNARSASSSCYITTIIHDILNNPDDCKVLNTLRAFRDNVLQKDEKYQDILLQYDTIGPQIAEHLAIDNDKELCSILYEKSLKPIARMIEEKNYLAAIINYQLLTLNLESCYGINNQSVKIEDYDQTLGGHGRVYTRKLNTI